MHDSANDRQGISQITVIAVIVILVVILVGAALVAVWIVHSIDSARQTLCRNNLRQIYIAAAQHNAQYDCYPAGVASCTPPEHQWYTGGKHEGTTASQRRCQGPNWLVALLPFMGMETELDSVEDGTFGMVQIADAAPSNLVCPAATPATRIVRDDNAGTWHLSPVSKGNYAANFGLSTFNMAINGPGDRQTENIPLPAPAGGPQTFGTLEERKRMSRGAFEVNFMHALLRSHFPISGFTGDFDPKKAAELSTDIGVRTDEFHDGLTHTLFVSEVITWDSELDIRGAWAVATPGASIFTAKLPPNHDGGPLEDTDVASTTHDRLIVCRTRDAATAPAIPAGHPLACTENRGTSGKPVFGQHPGGELWAAARSEHAGGVNAVMADGAVRFFSNDVDPKVWRAMSTRAGNRAEYAFKFPF